MAGNLQKKIEKIKKEILSLGAMVEDRFKKAVNAVRTNDTLLARDIIASDIEIDELEVEVEEECLKILALYQPVAIDLRFLIAVVKINNDLERVADLAANIAQRIKTVSGSTSNPFCYDYSSMAEKTGLMLKMSLDALVGMDSDMADQVIRMDKDVNAMRNRAYEAMKTAIIKAPDLVGQTIFNDRPYPGTGSNNC